MTDTQNAEEMELLKKRLEIAIKDLDRQFGENTVIRLGSANVVPHAAISTGALSLDVILGIGGVPVGRIIEVFGPESSGKSTLCLSLAHQAQKAGGIVLYIDAEHALDPAYAQNLGVNMDDLLLSQPETGEEALEIVSKVVETGAVSLVVVDSVAALTPRAELEGNMDQQHMGLLPRLMAKGMRKIVGAANTTDTTVIFVNQLREKIGIMFGNPETTPGGRALKFAASVRIDLRRVEDIKAKDGSVIGTRVKAKIPKNKMAPPLKVCEFDILYGRGVNEVGCIVDVATDRGVIKKSGAWYSFEGEQLGQGRDNTIEALASDLELLHKIEELVRNES